MTHDSSLLETLAEAKGTAFSIQGADDENVEAILHTIERPPQPTAEADQANLYFYLPSSHALPEGTYRVDHPEVEPFTVELEQVKAGGKTPDQTGYRAVILE